MGVAEVGGGYSASSSSSSLGLALGMSMAQPLLDSLGQGKAEKEGKGKHLDGAPITCQELYIHRTLILTAT